MTPIPQLMPQPRSIKVQDERFSLPAQAVIVVDPEHFFAAKQAQSSLAQLGLHWPVVTFNAADQYALTLLYSDTLSAQAYTLSVHDAGVVVQGDAAGLFYGVMTWGQLLRVYGRDLPRLKIEDSPDFLVRGVMLDISRDRVPTMETLYQLVDLLASLKINQFQLYTEHTFAYHAHPEVWAAASPMTAEEIMTLDRYCAERFIDLVPNQNSLGHMDQWLELPRYHDMAEKQEGYTTPWDGRWRPAGTFDPSDPRSLALFEELYVELLPNFRSSLFNVGCDEPWELGQGKNRQAVEERGGRVYLDWLKALHGVVSGQGRRMMFWADIIIHHPELVSELPEDVLVLEWGYEAIHPFDANCAVYAESVRDFYVCPGTSSWNALLGRTDNAIGNLIAAAEAGLKHGASGYLITDWGDGGHWQALPVSYLGFAYGAAVSWGLDANRDMDLPLALSRYVFDDPAEVMGQVVYDLGNVYQHTGPRHLNGQAAAYALMRDIESLRAWLGRAGDQADYQRVDVSDAALDSLVTALDAGLARLGAQQMRRADADLIAAELHQASALLKHGAKRLRNPMPDALAMRQELDALIMEQRRLWLMRSRRGGLEKSMRGFEQMRLEYLRDERPAQ